LAVTTTTTTDDADDDEAAVVVPGVAVEAAGEVVVMLAVDTLVAAMVTIKLVLAKARTRIELDLCECVPSACRDTLLARLR